MVRHTIFGKAIEAFRMIQDNVLVVYDIGACRGQWSKDYETTFPKAHFHLFDAIRKPNGVTVAGRSTWHEIVLSAPGVELVEFYSNSGGGDSYYKELTGKFDAVQPTVLPACTLDSLNLPPPQVMKLDTQGSELDILRGATKALSTALMIQVEMPISTFNRGGATFDECAGLLEKNGFVPVVLEEIHFWNETIVHVDLIYASRKVSKVCSDIYLRKGK